MPRCRLPLVAFGVILLGLAAAAAPSPNDGIQLLFMLCDPFGANTGLLWNNFERLGWDVTSTGTHAVIENCSYTTTSITVDAQLDALPGLGSFDALAISPTPGTHRYMTTPASDLRENQKALALIRQADAQGITLFAGCSAFLALADAGILEGRTVVHHSKLADECEGAGAACSVGSKSNPPLTDGNLITGTNIRYFALEIPEAIARSLDRLDAFEPSLDQLTLSDLEVTSVAIDPAGAVIEALALGTSLSDLAHDVCPLGGGFVVVGQTYSGDPGNLDALIARFGPDGQPLWTKTFGGPGRDTAHSVCVANDGGIVVAGLTTSAGAGSEDVLLFKLTADGGLLWTRTYGGTGADAAFGLCEAANGDLLVTGYTHAADVEFSALSLLHVDAAGEPIWSTTYDGRYYERGHSVVEGADGTFFVAGGSATLGQSNYNMMLAAFAANGEQLWTKSCGIGTYDIAEQVILTDRGDLVVVGFGDGSSDPNNAIVSRVDTGGEIVWRKRNGPRTSFDYGQGVIELASGDLLVCGALTGEETGRNDVWLLTYSADGDVVWEQQFGSDTENEWANALCRLADGRIVSVGWTRSHGAGSHDLLVMMIDPASIP